MELPNWMLAMAARAELEQERLLHPFMRLSEEDIKLCLTSIYNIVKWDKVSMTHIPYRYIPEELRVDGVPFVGPLGTMMESPGIITVYLLAKYYENSIRRDLSSGSH